MDLLRDLRHSVRSMMRSPGYALLCIAVIALGIGANTAIFSMVYSVILSPLPYPDAERLVFIWEKFPAMPDPLGSRLQTTRRNYQEWTKQAQSFSEMAAFQETALNETGAEQARHTSVGSASGSLFSLLGARPALGRLFSPNEEGQVAVLSDAYFARRFQRDPSALGRPIVLDGKTYSVVGVLPPNFHLPAMFEGMDQKKPEVWVPLSRLWRTPADDRLRQLYVMARLKPGVPLEQARAEMTGIAGRLEKADPEMNTGMKTSVFPAAVEDTAPTLHRALYVLLGAVAFLLLIACANLANLTLARIGGRHQEIAVRLALGATRGRIAGQLLGEALLISLSGAAVGLLLAHWGVKAMMALKPEEFQRPELIALNLPVFVFAAVMSVVTALLFGLAPALSASRLDLNQAMKSGGRSGSAGRSWSRQALIVAEIGLAMILVSGAGLMIRSFREMVSTGIGFRTERLISMDIDLPEKRYGNGLRQSRFYRDVLDRVRDLPGVAAASVVDNLPLHRVSFTNFYIAGRPDPPLNALPMSDFAASSPEYLSMIGMRLQQGRYFTERDLTQTEKGGDGVVIVNQAWVQKFMSGEEALGKRILNQSKKNAFEIVGVVADYRPLGTENGPRPQIFWANLQLNSASLLVRTHGDPGTITSALQAVVTGLDKEIPTNKVETMEHHLHYWISQRQFNTLLMTLFAGLALLLAMIGVYGVLANMVASRTREIGIRMAIGAGRGGVAKLIIGQSLKPVVIGLALGLAGSLALSRYLESLLFQVRADDWMTRAVAIGTMLLVTPLAIFVPLRRAMGVDCAVALREE